MARPIITLTTDFGTTGPYVAEMKGVILGINPEVNLIDISHEIAPQNIREAALCLAQVVAHFPRGTIHVVVVDPAVGTQRRLLCVRMHEQTFLAPDNGVLSWAARAATSVEMIELAEPKFWRTRVSSTFHGRDILAPVAARLSLGMSPRELGPAVTEWVELGWPNARVAANQIDGEVLAVDHFGNLISNISTAELGRLAAAPRRVLCNGQDAGPLVQTYADGAAGALLALIGSSDLLEIALRDGSAAARLNCGVGAAVRVTTERPL